LVGSKTPSLHEKCYRLATLIAHAGGGIWECADSSLQIEIQRHRRETLRTTGRIPRKFGNNNRSNAGACLSPTPALILLDLHFSLRATRKVYIGL
jgi:hypothetical protein